MISNKSIKTLSADSQKPVFLFLYNAPASVVTGLLCTIIFQVTLRMREDSNARYQLVMPVFMTGTLNHSDTHPFA